MKRRLRILVVDDHEVVRKGVATLLSEDKRYEVCGLAVDGSTALEQVQKLKPDLVILDLSMPGVDGFGAASKLVQAHPTTKLLVLTVHASEQLSNELRAMGIHGYVTKSLAARELMEAVERLSRGGTYYTGRDGISPNTDHPGGLTPREAQVLRILAEGKTNKEAAEILEISVKTVETHRARLMRKLKLKTVAELVRYAIRHRYVSP